MTDQSLPAGVDAALARLQGTVDRGFAQTNGRLDLLIHRADRQDQRTDAIAADVDGLRDRLSVVEGAAVTRDDLEQRQAAAARTVTIVVSVLAIVVGSGTSVLTSVLT